MVVKVVDSTSRKHKRYNKKLANKQIRKGGRRTTALNPFKLNKRNRGNR